MCFWTCAFKAAEPISEQALSERVHSKRRKHVNIKQRSLRSGKGMCFWTCAFTAAELISEQALSERVHSQW